MTAPAPALTAVLDELDELRAKGHELPWGLLGGTHDCEVISDLGHHVVSTHQPSDAALIVAAVNRLPELTAALRAVLGLHPRLEPRRGHVFCGGREHGSGFVQSWPCPTVAAITTALEAS